jgi:membrane-bound lytic murein transglycosylase D
VADNGQIGLAPEVVARRTVIKAGKNESVSSVAKRYNLAASSVAEWNKLGATSAFKAGQQVVLFLPSRGKAAVRTASAGNRAVRVAAKPTRRPVAQSTRLAKR